MSSRLMAWATARRTSGLLNGGRVPLNSTSMKAAPCISASFSLGSASTEAIDCQGTYSIMSRSPERRAALRRFSSAYAVNRMAFSFGRPGL